MNHPRPRSVQILQAASAWGTNGSDASLFRASTCFNMQMFMQIYLATHSSENAGSATKAESVIGFQEHQRKQASAWLSCVRAMASREAYGTPAPLSSRGCHVHSGKYQGILTTSTAPKLPWDPEGSFLTPHCPSCWRRSFM